MEARRFLCVAVGITTEEFVFNPAKSNARNGKTQISNHANRVEGDDQSSFTTAKA